MWRQLVVAVRVMRRTERCTLSRSAAASEGDKRQVPAKATAASHDARGYTDQHIMEWSRSAVRCNWRNHTDRYQGEPAFRAQCIASHKPERLMWASGRWVGIDSWDIQPSG